MGKQDWKRSWKPWLRGTAFGFPFGALPAGGAKIPTFLSYVTEKRLSKHPEEFGKGAIEGVAGPEAANNAAAAGTLTPMLALGLPTNATAAVMLAAFTSYGIQPGPQLFTSEGPLVWALIASLFIGNFLLLVINLPLAPLWAKLLQLPRPYLYAGILFFATLGAYSVNLQAFDLVILLVLGALGFMMRRFGLPGPAAHPRRDPGPACRRPAAQDPPALRRRPGRSLQRADRRRHLHHRGDHPGLAAAAEGLAQVAAAGGVRHRQAVQPACTRCRRTLRPRPAATSGWPRPTATPTTDGEMAEATGSTNQSVHARRRQEEP